MKVLHILARGETGGLEILCKNIALKSDWENIVCFVCGGGTICDEMKEDEIPVKILNNNFLKIKKSVKQLVEICKNEKIDIVNLHDGGTHLQIVYLLMQKKLNNIKFIKTVHTVYEKKFFVEKNKNIIKAKINYITLKKALKKSNKVICVSKAVQKSLVDEFKLQNTRVVYNGIDISSTTINKNKIIKNDIVYVGRVEKVKGIELLIKAVSILKEKGIDTNLCIVGEGDYSVNIKKLVEELDIKDRINIVGRQNHNKVGKIMNESKIFVYPSIWQEAFGISIIEAMEQGCICIAFKKGGIPEIINDYENGFIIEKESEELLAEKLEYVLRIFAEGKTEKIKEKALKTAQRFSIENTIKNLRLEYENVLNERK